MIANNRTLGGRMPKEMNLDPSAFMIIADALAEGHQGDPEAAQLVQALQDEDSEVQQIEAEHAAQLDRIIAAPIRGAPPSGRKFRGRPRSGSGGRFGSVSG